MSSLNNTPALLRSLIVYAITVPLAILVGYMLTGLDQTSVFWIAVIVGVMVFPLLLRFHYQLLLFSWAAPILLFFVPARPQLFIMMAAASLGISVTERILSSQKRFLSAPQITAPALAMLGVIIMTAEMTGGIGVKSMGGSVYGGKKYIMIIIGILSFFALIARPIPKEKVKLYFGLYLAGLGLSFVQDLYALAPGPFKFIYLFFNFSGNGMDESGHTSFELGTTHLSGFAATGSALSSLMLVIYGIRGVFMGGKLWRPIVLIISVCMLFLGGQRTPIIVFLLLFSVLFWLEDLHRSRLILPFVAAAIIGSLLIIPMAKHLPYTFQRSLAFLPLDIDASARASADDSSEWRLKIWEALLPEVPKHLLLGTGLAIDVETLNEMGGNTTFKVIDAANQPLALSHDVHNGPLSIILPFGIWGILAWLWFWAGILYVLLRNYKYGDPDLKLYNRFLLASFLANCLFFTFIFGAMEHVAGFCLLGGLSVAINHGVRGPSQVKAPNKPQVFAGAKPANRPYLGPGIRPGKA